MPSPSTATGTTDAKARRLSPAHHETADTREVWLSVGEMSCGGCAARLQTRLNELPGVEATVNFATERAQVRSSLPTSTIVDLVNQAGFSARLVATHDRVQEQTRTEADG